MTNIELHHLLDKLVAGDQAAFEAVYEHTIDDVYRTVAFLVFDRQDIQDIVNEVYIQMWKSLHTYDRTRAFRFWLHGLVVRQVQDWKRKVWRRLRLLDRKKSLEVEEFAETDRTVLQSETRQELSDALQHLSYKLRVVIILRYFHSYSLEEIATLLHIPVGTVKSRHHLALKKLREQCINPFEGKVESPYVY
ncbi:MAG: sigma-70 family RNA polymerase sigma factor [Tumebacillaceae bacterium]